MYIKGIVTILVIFLLVGCSLNKISNYDKQTDDSVTKLQKEVEQLLVKLEGEWKKPECSYNKNKKFYDAFKIDTSSIIVRAKAIEKNERTVKQLDLLKENISDLESLHKIKCLSPKEIKPLRIILNTHFTAILKLELSKIHASN